MDRNEDITRKPIAVFDSGVGGISVLREMVALMPNEDFLYYGDSANAPYGTRPTEEIRSLTIGHVEDFLSRGVKAVAIACNTATSAAVKDLRSLYPKLPLVGIEPALKPAVECKEYPSVLVMATPMTIRQEKFQSQVHKYEEKARIYQLPCPGLMEFVETGHYDSKEVYDFLEQLLFDYRDKNLDAAVLGCTHYPFVRRQIQEILGPQTRIFDGAEGTARELKRRIEEAGLQEKDRDRRGHVIFENSAPTEAKMQLCQLLLNCS